MKLSQSLKEQHEFDLLARREQCEHDLLLAKERHSKDSDSTTAAAKYSEFTLSFHSKLPNFDDSKDDLNTYFYYFEKHAEASTLDHL